MLPTKDKNNNEDSRLIPDSLTLLVTITQARIEVPWLK